MGVHLNFVGLVFVNSIIGIISSLGLLRKLNDKHSTNALAVSNSFHSFELTSILLNFFYLAKVKGRLTNLFFTK